MPLGAVAEPGGVNFAVYSPHATRLWLRLYRDRDRGGAHRRVRARRAAPPHLRLLACVRGRSRAPAGTTRGAPTGPKSPTAGLHFEPRRELLDPWARLISDATWQREQSIEGSFEPAVRAKIAPPDEYDWEGDTPLERPLAESVIYEVHVRGFTRHASSAVQQPGTFRGVDREDSVLAVARRHGCRAVAGVRLRSAGRPGDRCSARPDELLGLHARSRSSRRILTTRPATTRGASFGTWSKRCTRPESA